MWTAHDSKTVVDWYSNEFKRLGWKPVIGTSYFHANESQQNMGGADSPDRKEQIFIVIVNDDKRTTTISFGSMTFPKISPAPLRNNPKH